ncbi:MAG: hypothetical protein KDA24_24125 [Deltaproteobacteria bacterium]|nr:hypothetical protein [Deltaproteobacteria bacterium]
MKTHPPEDAPRLTEAFIALATGTNEKAKREASFGPTRHDVRLLRGFVEDAQGLPAGSRAMEKHLGYRICMINGTEPPEMMSVYSDVRSHAGTWAAHEQAIQDRGERMLFLARHMIDDVGDVEDGLDDGSMRVELMSELLHGVHSRAVDETKQVQATAKALLEFSSHIRDVLNVKIEDKTKLSEATEHDTDNHMQRARLKRQLVTIKKAEKNYARVLDTDEGNILGRRLARTVFAEDAVSAYDAVHDACYALKKSAGEVAIMFRVPKSLANRRVQLGYAMLGSHSASQGLRHLGVLWETCAAALGAAAEAFDAAKDTAGRKAAVTALQPLMDAWAKLPVLTETIDDIFR